MISVCIATHNGEKYIQEQINSILSQLSSEDEVVISDDGSSDSTLEIIKSYNDSRIHLYEQKSPVGLLAHEYATLNFENALNHAKGEFIILSDQDDVWCDNKVEVIKKYLRDYPYIVSDCYVTDSNLNIISETRFTKDESYHINKYAALVLSTPYQGSCAAFRREVLEKALPFPKGLQSHDRWIGDVAAFFFSVKIVPDSLIYYRRHEGTASNALGGSGKSSGVFKTLHYKWIYVWNIIKLKFKWESNKRLTIS